MTEAGIVDWLDQFNESDRDIAARLLDAVEFISAEQLHAAFQSILDRLPGWHRQSSKRSGRFAFVAFSSSAGESGDSMLHEFRLANKLNKSQFDPLFISRSDIVRERFGANDTVVFLDDFVGTGNQAVKAWQNMFQELTAGIGSVYLATVAAFTQGASRIRAETQMQLLAHRHLSHNDSIFHDDCQHFKKKEKDRIMYYCKRASTKRPCGFGDCGLLIVLYHQCPNNSIAVLHSASQEWDPLFPRN